MSVLLSTGLKGSLMVTGSARSALTGTVLRIYSGVVPTSPDDALSGNTLLLEVSDSGTGAGLEWESLAQDGALLKRSTQTWSGTSVATGTATFFRLVMPSDTGSYSSTAIRMQGSVGVLSGDMVLPTAQLASGTIQNINAGAFSLI